MEIRIVVFFLYGIKVWGQLKTERASWIVPGASENEVNIHRVDIIPYHDEAAKSLELKLSNYCPDNFEWSLFQSHTLYRKMHDKYNYTPHWEREAHDMKLSRPHHHDHKWRDELFFGDIHTKIKRRTRYRPTALQAHPLLRGHKTHKTCKICRKVALANLSNPPRLTQRFFVPVNLEGEWISRRCETRPNSLFLMRRLTFYPSNRSWEGIYSYFADEKCSNGVFKILAKGKYLQKGSSEIVHGGTNFDFKIKTAHLTPVAQSLANQLNHLPSGSCGIAGSWKVGVIQEVTSTGGCKGLGLTIPITELDLLKMESNLDGSRLLLSLGQTDTDAVLHNHKKEQEGLRPTSYQPPLLQCRMFSDSSNPNNELFPVMSHLKSNPLRNLVSSSNSLLYPSMTCTCSFLIISCMGAFSHSSSYFCILSISLEECELNGCLKLDTCFFSTSSTNGMNEGFLCHRTRV
ncbi:unnamed protein product [Lepeophtheirus salmonis]|uniref:(salmon louse) hypothetical protein n=1 Tax=Lepeophtheirus salmonis TaxID=72036 RepID=A0A7R8H9T6_LEPSM|nr:unnamed protein product [Lepeophtheirus salmonis]CAF2960489.1 unnamed protein product [Lepeophtheirus salmonis]